MTTTSALRSESGNPTLFAVVVNVNLSKHEVEQLPSIDIDHPEGGQGPEKHGVASPVLT